MVTFAFFWEQSGAFNRGCPCVVFSFTLPQRLGEGRSVYTMWHDLKSVSTTVAVENTALPEQKARLTHSHTVQLQKDKIQNFHII